MKTKIYKPYESQDVKVPHLLLDFTIRDQAHPITFFLLEYGFALAQNPEVQTSTKLARFRDFTDDKSDIVLHPTNHAGLTRASDPDKTKIDRSQLGHTSNLNHIIRFLHIDRYRLKTLHLFEADITAPEYDPKTNTFHYADQGARALVFSQKPPSHEEINPHEIPYDRSATLQLRVA